MDPAQPRPFTSFHTKTVQLPPEVTTRIISYTTTAQDLLGSPRSSLPPISQVSWPIRNVYLDLHSQFDFGLGKRRIPYKLTRQQSTIQRQPDNTRPRIGETLNFPDLRSLASFFTTGPGRPELAEDNKKFLARIKFVRIVYMDIALTSYLRYGFSTLDYAYEAFELLADNQDRLNIQRLQLHSTHHNIETPDQPGIWSLLKLRGITNVIVSGGVTINHDLRSCLQTRLGWQRSRQWTPIGTERTGIRDWQARVKQRPTGTMLEWQWDWLEKRYNYLHDRETCNKRRIKMRKARDKRRGGVSKQSRTLRRNRAKMFRSREQALLAAIDK